MKIAFCSDTPCIGNLVAANKTVELTDPGIGTELVGEGYQSVYDCGLAALDLVPSAWAVVFDEYG